MEVIEIVIGIVVSLIVGLLVLGVLSDWDYTATYDTVASLFAQDTEDAFQIETELLPAVMVDVLDACQHTQAERLVHVDGTGSLTMDSLFADIKELSLCSTLSSIDQGCGSLDNVIPFSQIALPAVVMITCNGTRLGLSEP